MKRLLLMQCVGFGLLVTFLCPLPIVAQQSLWQKDQETPTPEGIRPDRVNRSAYADPPPEQRTLKKHDLITVLILERTQGDTKADSTIRKDAQLQAELKEFIRFKREPTKRSGLADMFGYRLETAVNNSPTVDFEVQYNKRNRGQTKRSNSLAGKITAKVIKVLPNRNLIIEARKTRRINDEIETVLVTGEIRSDDVGSDNTILSERIADLRIAYTGEGTVDDAQKSGWFGKLLETMWPF